MAQSGALKKTFEEIQNSYRPSKEFKMVRPEVPGKMLDSYFMRRNNGRTAENNNHTDRIYS